jgi:hypothetical protein
VYYATCFEYFIDIKQIEEEFIELRPHFYDDYLSKQIAELDFDDESVINSIIRKNIPAGRYFLPFTMCLIS